jgi:hypothetical protein
MNAPNHESLSVLCDAYLLQIDRYQRAVDTTKSLVTAFSDGRDAGPGLRKLDQTLNEVAEIQEQIEPIRQHYMLQPAATGGELQDVTRQLADTIKTLIAEIEAAQNQARRARDRLVPELSQETRRQKMRATYGKR